jgi:HK97 family phage portal protein
MNPIRWLASRLSGYAYKATGPRGLTMIASWLANVLWTMDTSWHALATEGYGRNPVVYNCIRLLSQSVPEARLTAYTGDAEKRKELPPDHPLRLLLKSWNELMTQFESLELMTIHVSVTGRTVFWKERSVGGQTIALWPLRPDRVGPVYSTSQKAGERVIAGYAYQAPGAVSPIMLPRQDCVAVNFPDPDGESGGMVEGFGPLAAIARQVSADNKATDHVGALLGNYAQPGVAIEIQDNVSEEEGKLIKAKFRQEFGGGGMGTPALIQAGAKIIPLGFNLRDLEFPDLRANAEARICGAFGVPAILAGVKVGLDRSTFANMAESRQFFAETTCSWYWRRYADAFTNQLAADFGEGITIDFDTSGVRALAGQKIERLQPIKDGFASGVVMLNDYRQALGLDPLDPELGEVLYIPNNVTVTPATDKARAAIEKRKADAEKVALQKQKEQARLNPPPPVPQLPAPAGQQPPTNGQTPSPDELALMPDAPIAGKSADVVIIPLDDELAEALGMEPAGYLVARNGHTNGGPSIDSPFVGDDATKYNPHHGRDGRFTSGHSGGGIYIPKPGGHGFRLDVGSGPVGPTMVQKPAGPHPAVAQATGKIHNGLTGAAGKKAEVSVRGAIDFLGEDAHGLVKASKITISSKPGSSANVLASYSHSANEIRIHPKTFAGKTESHPVMLGATLYHEAAHAAQPKGMSVRDAEREATRQTLDMLNRRLATNKNPAHEGALRRAIANEEWYSRQF